MSQVQYPSDFVGADGVIYPTVGEAFRMGSFNSRYIRELKNIYSEVLTDIITITRNEETSIMSNMGIEYNTSGTIIYSNAYNIVKYEIISATVKSSVTISVSSFYVSSVNKIGLNTMSTKGSVVLMVVLAN